MEQLILIDPNYGAYMNNTTTIGVISDTHGKLNHRVSEIFNGVDFIFHAGDIGEKSSVMMNLESIAPIYVARGNCDSLVLPYEIETEIANVAIYMIHDLYSANSEKSKKAQLVITGHTHCPEIEKIGQTQYLNPGSASRGRRGFSESVAIVKITQGKLDIDIVELKN